jgi:ribosomal protein S18 acetylase RimI-like enzyme
MATSASPLEVTIAQITKEEDFLPLATIEEAAFTGPQTTLFYGASASHDPSIAAARHTRIFKTDPTALYCKACLPSGQIIGLAKWNLFKTAGPHFPWPTSGFAEDANVELLNWFFGCLDAKRNAFMVPRGKGYLYMALLAVDPKCQRMGVGRKLLEWGLEKADREGLECWIEASPAGKPLYEKVGWREVGFTDVELRRWGWTGEEEVSRTVSMFRVVGGKSEV